MSTMMSTSERFIGDSSMSSNSTISLSNALKSSSSPCSSCEPDTDRKKETGDIEDVGLYPESYYYNHLLGFVFKIRSLLYPLIEHEQQYLIKLQSYQNSYLDQYFLYTANIGSHTFYVILLPLPFWLGSINLARDLVFVLGLGIYFSGFIKDLLCLPRPISPPIKRLTHSKYTSKEYGCPSSHSANAIAVSLLCFFHTLNNESLASSTKMAIYSILIIYYFTLTSGRLYCGMHGFVDIVCGNIIGLFTLFFRFKTKNMYDTLLLTSHSILLPICIVIGYYCLLIIHPKPLEKCPCFEDTVAFISVLMGLDVTFWSFNEASNIRELSELYLNHTSRHLCNFEDLGLVRLTLRVVLNILLVIFWKAISKPILVKVLPITNKEDCYAFLSKFDNKIIIKIIVYAIIPCVAIYVKFLYPYLNLE